MSLYTRQIDSYHRPLSQIRRDFEQEICSLLCSTFRGKHMRQFGFSVKLCVREIIFGSSIQAQWIGNFMRQNWRIYGISDNSERHHSRHRNLL